MSKMSKNVKNCQKLSTLKFQHRPLLHASIARKLQLYITVTDRWKSNSEGQSDLRRGRSISQTIWTLCRFIQTCPA
jgi:hypothetical protein